MLQETVGRQPTTYLSLLAEVDLQTGWKKLALRLPRDDGYSIDLLIARKERCLLVISARRTSAGKYVHEVEITPRLHVGVDSAEPIPQELLNRLRDLPTREEREAEVDARLARWVRYLEVEQRHAEAQRFAVPYSALHRHENPGRIRVDLAPGTPQILLDRVAECRRGDRLHLSHLDEGPDDDGRGGRRLASAEFRSYDGKTRRLTLDLEDDDADSHRAGRLVLPEEGLIVNDAAGSLAMIHRQQKGIERLKLHGGALPNLDRILFGGNDELPLAPFPPVEPVPLDECLDPTRINERQRLAVALGLHTPDCLFLQGPPGTGKTTVIAELCYQLAKRGKRVLVASQANLAVDNALSRLQHSRDILAVRLGPSDKVEEDAQEFVGDRAVQRWLRSVKEHSRARAKQLRRHLDAKAWFDAHGSPLADWAKNANRSAQRQRQFLDDASKLRREADELIRCAESESDRAAHLQMLVAALGSHDTPSPQVRAIWTGPTAAAAREAWQTDVEPVRSDLGFDDRNPWALGRALRQQESALASEDDFRAAVAEAQQVIEAYRDFPATLAAATEEADRTSRAYAAAEAEAERRQSAADFARQEYRNWRQFAEGLQEHTDAPPLGSEWDQHPDASPTAAALTDRLHRLQVTLSVPSGADSPRQSHPDLPGLVESWAAFERDGRTDDASRAFAAIEAATAKLADRATHPIWGLLFRSRYRRHAELLRSTSAKLLQELRQAGAKRYHVADIIRREREAYVRHLEAAARDKAAAADAAETEARQAQEDADARAADRIRAAARVRRLSEQVQALVGQLRSQFGARTGTARALADLENRALADPAGALTETADVLRSAHADWDRLRARLHQYAQTLTEARNHAARSIHAEATALATRAEADAGEAERLVAEAAEYEAKAADIDRLLTARTELWTDACEWAGAEPGDGPPTLDRIREVRRAAVGPADDPDRLDREARLLADWVERIEAGGDVSRELTQEFHRRANVVGVTCAHAGKRAFYQGAPEYDVVIVDEVSKATPTELLLPALLGKRIVLVGDHRQLPPIFGQEGSFEEAAAELGIATDELKEALQSSLFKERYEHLDTLATAGGDGASTCAPRAVMLTTQYRMHSHIMVGVNQFYHEQLRLGHLDVDGRSVPLDEHRTHGLTCLPWLSPDDHLVWIDTPTSGDWGHTQDGTTRFNQREADVVARVLDGLTAAADPNRSPLDIGVTSVYASQVRRLRSAVDQMDLPPDVRDRLRISTVDKFQGMERDVMVVSLVLNGRGHRPSGFLRTPERVNVAMSRARRLLVIVGSSYNYCELTGAESPYARFYDVARLQGRIVEASLLLHA